MDSPFTLQSYKLELLQMIVIVTWTYALMLDNIRCLKVHERRKEQLDTLQKIDDKTDALEGDTTTNGVF